MATGTVKWISVPKGYGYIKIDEGAEIFVHASDVLARPEGNRPIVENDRVEFEIVPTEKGPRAENVRKIRTEE